MSDTRKIHNVEISKECHKKIKILSIQKELPLHVIASEILERAMSKKQNNIEELN